MLSHTGSCEPCCWQVGPSGEDEVALKFLLKIGKYPQGAGEDDEAYAARLERAPDPDVMAYRGFEAANDL
jgi:hypothetical protein